MADDLEPVLGQFRATLTGRDLEIFDRRLTSDEPLTLSELGDEFGMSRDDVRRLEADLIVRLREFLHGGPLSA